MTRYYKLCVGVGQCQDEEIIEVADGEVFPTEKELDEYLQDFVYGHADPCHCECDADGNCLDELLTENADSGEAKQ